MAEQTATDTNEQHFAIHKLYTKDLSFEAPNTPEIFKGKWEPKVNVQLNNKTDAVGDGNYEVVLTITVTVNIGDKTAYLVEVQQAGIFALKGFADDQLEHMLGAYCPSIMFPYAREVVSDIVTKGGFPQMVLQPVNFDALYAAQKQQKTETTEASH